MRCFSYRAKTKQGKLVKGTVAAQAIHEARAMLRQQGLEILECKLARMLTQPKLRSKERQLFAQQLAQLLRAGLPVYDALQAFEERMRGQRQHIIWAQIINEVRGGRSLSQAMQLQPQHFDRLFIGLIAAGEASGSLERALVRLDDLLRRQDKIRQQMQQALTYPAVVISVAIGVVLFLLLGAVPSLEPLLEGHEIEGITAFLLSMSHGLLAHGWTLLMLCVAAITALLWHGRTLHGRERWLSMLVRTPLIGPLLIAGALSRTFRTMMTLLQGDIALLEALRLARRSANLPELRKALGSLEEGLVQGQALSTLVEQHSVFPGHISKMLSLAEDSGDIIPCLEQISALYEEESAQRMNKLQQFMQPAILLFLGVVVGLILVGILLPLTNVQQLVGGANGN